MRRIFVLAAVLGVSAVHAATVPEGAIQLPADVQVWKPGSPSLPAGSQMLVLEGDPKKPGLFTIRLKLPAGSRVQPHWHPQPERATVISGTVAVGFGESFDEAHMKTFGAGSYYVNPPRVPHYLSFRQDSVVQLTSEGPWELHYVDEK
jgi:quercetin dioxygenase-like cupin family protein